jgi:hypothetical protein
LEEKKRFFLKRGLFPPSLGYFFQSFVNFFSFLPKAIPLWGKVALFLPLEEKVFCFPSFYQR